MFFIWEQELVNAHGHFICIFPIFEFLHHSHIGISVHKGKYCLLPVSSYDKIHLKITDTFPIDLSGSLVNINSVRDR